MARYTPRVERTCLVCESLFEGTPKSIRCSSCKDAGLRVPFRKQSQRRKELAVLNAEHAVLAGELAAMAFERTAEELAIEREERRKAELEKRLEAQAAYLDARSRIPKGYRKMRIEQKLPLNLLWLQLCAADGAASSLIYGGARVDLSEDEKVVLLTSYLRLRCKGYHTDAIAKVCPRSLLQNADAPEDLPEVTEAFEGDAPFTPFERDAELQAEMPDIAENQARRADAVALGLTD